MDDFEQLAIRADGSDFVDFVDDDGVLSMSRCPDSVLHNPSPAGGADAAHAAPPGCCV